MSVKQEPPNDRDKTGPDNQPTKIVGTNLEYEDVVKTLLKSHFKVGDGVVDMVWDAASGNLTKCFETLQKHHKINTAKLNPAKEKNLALLMAYNDGRLHVVRGFPDYRQAEGLQRTTRHEIENLLCDRLGAENITVIWPRCGRADYETRLCYIEFRTVAALLEKFGMLLGIHFNGKRLTLETPTSLPLV